MIKPTCITIGLALSILTLTTTPALAEIYDSHNYLNPVQVSQINQITEAARADKLNLSVAIVKSEDLNGYGSLQGNLDVENFNKELLSKQTEEGYKSFTMTLVPDRKNAKGETPVYRYAGTKSLSLSQESIKALLDQYFIRNNWQESLPIVLANLYQQELQAQTVGTIIGVIVIVAIIVLVIFALITSAGSKGYSSGSSDSFTFFDFSDSSGSDSFSGGD